uniref:Uncharacterized protein n=1 Tax=Strongyloides stercoralis TaxID=6248 RepID=A0AAF5DPY3_STRER
MKFLILIPDNTFTYRVNTNCVIWLLTMAKICPLCGPKLSTFLMLISAWGVVFLGILGVFFYTQAVTLFPDLHFSEEGGVSEGPSDTDIEVKYSEKATQCWIAAGMYVVTFIVVVWQNKYNPVSIL